MITVLSGDNSFEIKRELERITADFDGSADRLEGVSVDIKQLPDIFMGGSLFAMKRLVIIRELSENKTVWNELGNWLERIDDDIHLVLIEPKPDRRTRTYKDLKKSATVREFAIWGDRDANKAEAWLVQEAKAQGITLDGKSTQALIRRVGLDPWALYHSLQKLAVFDPVTETAINESIDASPSENVFNLFDAALKGDTAKVVTMIETLRRTEDAYMVFGLLASQAFQLAALAVGDGEDVAKDIGAHPFALSKLSPHARHQGKGGSRKIITVFAEADDRMKSAAADPWTIVEQALIKVAAIV